MDTPQTNLHPDQTRCLFNFVFLTLLYDADSNETAFSYHVRRKLQNALPSFA